MILRPRSPVSHFSQPATSPTNPPSSKTKKITIPAALSFYFYFFNSEFVSDAHDVRALSTNVAQTLLEMRFFSPQLYSSSKLYILH